VRHRGKIEAVINNARCALDLLGTEGSLSDFVWRYEPTGTPPEPQSVSTTPESTALAKEVKRRGWRFVGPTTVYAFMQAMGLVNDHAVGCSLRVEVDLERAKRSRPT
jgi:DNA-3-methyladenine glycosylase I